MLRWAIIFLGMAIVAGILGWGEVAGLTGVSGWIAQLLFFVFLVLFAIWLVAGLTNRRAVP